MTEFDAQDARIKAIVGDDEDQSFEGAIERFYHLNFAPISGILRCDSKSIEHLCTLGLTGIKRCDFLLTTFSGQNGQFSASSH